MVYDLNPVTGRTMQRKTFMDYGRAQAEFEEIKRQRQMQEQMRPLQMQREQLQNEFLMKKLNAKPDFDLGQVTQSALMKYNMGQELTPEEQAAIKTSVMMNPAKTQYQPDEYGNVRAVTTPNPLQSVLGGNQPQYRTQGINPQAQMASAQQYGQGGDDPLMASRQAIMQRNAEGIQNPYQTMPPLPDEQGQDFYSMMGVSDPRAITAPKSQLGGVGAAQDLISEREKLRMKTEEEIRKEALLSERARPQEINQAERAFVNGLQSAQNINTVIDRALNQANVFTTGVGGAITGIVPGSPATDLAENMKTIEADAAFSTLQTMREASKTGGALGAISERELGLLSAAKAALSTSQSPSQFRENLQRYKSVRNSAINNVAEAFKQDYGYYPNGFEDFAARGSAQSVDDLVEYYSR